MVDRGQHQTIVHRFVSWFKVSWAEKYQTILDFQRFHRNRHQGAKDLLCGELLCERITDVNARKSGFGAAC